MPERPPRKFKKLRRYEGLNHARAINFSCFRNQPFLSKDRSRQWAVDAVALGLEKHQVHLWAYAIMPTHVHLLVYPRHIEASMAAFCSTVKQSVAKRALVWVRSKAPRFLEYMKDVQPNGRQSYRFWQRGGGYDRNLWSPKHIWEMIDYIHNNPVEAGLCDDPRDWYWSSAPSMLAGGSGPLPIDLEHLPPDPR